MKTVLLAVLVLIMSGCASYHEKQQEQNIKKYINDTKESIEQMKTNESSDPQVIAE